MPSALPPPGWIFSAIARVTMTCGGNSSVTFWSISTISAGVKSRPSSSFSPQVLIRESGVIYTAATAELFSCLRLAAKPLLLPLRDNGTWLTCATETTPGTARAAAARRFCSASSSL